MLKDLQKLTEKIVAYLREITKSFLDQRLALEPISASELLSKMNEDDIVIIDVRPKDEFLKGHIPGAISIPLAELNERLMNYQRIKKL
ncbi:MAG: rhodanese-like domain-containing protein [Melioribacteraceae bacterium]